MPNYLCFLKKLVNLSIDQKYSAVWKCVLQRNYHQLSVQDSCFRTLNFPLLIHKKSYKILNMASNRYCIDLAKRGQAGCKKCKQKIEKGLLRIGKIVPSPFGDPGSEMKLWYHIRCMFEQQLRARATTKKIEGPEDLEGWDDIDADFQEDVLKCMEEFAAKAAQKTPKKSPRKTAEKVAPQDSPQTSVSSRSLNPLVEPTGHGKVDTFREFRRLCAAVSEDPSHNGKTAIISDFFKKGPDEGGFKGELHLWVKMLLPLVNKRVYNLQSKQLVKLFSQIFCTNQEDMLEDLEQGDIAETIRIFFENSKACPPTKKSSLTLQEVDNFLEKLKTVTREEDQMQVLRQVTERCTGNDLKMFVRLIKHDLRINAGPKPILDALHPTAYQAFQASRNLEDVINRVLKQKEVGSLKKELSIRTSLMTPILPMLAEPCRSVEYAFKKCPNGLLVEIKYDGERVQVHKKGDEFNYFSRSLKPVMAHKVTHLKDFIPKAFPHGNDLILDSEVLLIDTDGKPLPFGTLGVHKKSAFKDANVCLFIFDCIQFNDQVLLDKPLTYRRKILQENMTPIKNHIMFSEMKPVNSCGELKEMIHSVIQQGLEGLIIKDKKSVYEPGKRHWLKVKKDYLEKGAMADSADLVVLGAYFGTGIKGGMMSVFLMGCFDKKTEKWCTVTKVYGGHDDATLHRLQTELEMVKISKDPNKIPDWLSINKMQIPDFVSKDPKKSPVWEITGAEFTKAEIHTAGGISIRFPRVTRIRDDKSWHEATSLQELQKLYKKSKETTDMIGLSSVSPIDKNKSYTNSGIGPGSGGTAAEEVDDNYYNETDVDSDCEMIGEKPSTERKSAVTSSAKRKIQFEPKPIIDSMKEENKLESDTPVKKLKQDKVYSPQADFTSKQKSRLPVFKCSFPNVFTGVKLILPSSIDQVNKLRRYFTAYDGEILEDHEVENSTHVIVLPTKTSMKYPRGAERVTVDWLWDSIKLQRLLPADIYKPISS